MKARLPKRGLYILTPDTDEPISALGARARLAIRGGATMVQYRDKIHRGCALITRAAYLKRVCTEMSVPFIVNDDPDLACAIDADGIHIGQHDPALEDVRSRVGDGKIIGVSCYNDLHGAREAQARGADYVAFGSFYPSVTKPEARRATITLLRAANNEIHIPVVAIGGILPSNATSLLQAGADFIAVTGGVLGQRDPLTAAWRYARLFTR